MEPEHCQPCENYTPDPEEGGGKHCCPHCEGTRRWCANCHLDHHSGGWESCGVTDKMRGCTHSKCKAKVAERDTTNHPPSE